MNHELHERGRGIPPWLYRVQVRLSDSSGHVPSREELAMLAGVDAAHLSRSFRAHFGMTVMGYARSRRLADALRWLSWTDEPVAGVARRFGYCDQGHLSRECRRYTGMTPAAWRRAAVFRRVGG